MNSITTLKILFLDVFLMLSKQLLQFQDLKQAAHVDSSFDETERFLLPDTCGRQERTRIHFIIFAVINACFPAFM